MTAPSPPSPSAPRTSRPGAVRRAPPSRPRLRCWRSAPPACRRRWRRKPWACSPSVRRCCAASARLRAWCRAASASAATVTTIWVRCCSSVTISSSPTSKGRRIRALTSGAANTAPSSTWPACCVRLHMHARWRYNSRRSSRCMSAANGSRSWNSGSSKHGARSLRLTMSWRARAACMARSNRWHRCCACSSCRPRCADLRRELVHRPEWAGVPLRRLSTFAR